MLSIETLCPDTFRPFGDVIAVDESRRHFTINDGYAHRFHDLAHIDVASSHGYPIISIFRAQPRQLPLHLHVLERHPLGSQSFFPLSSQPFLVVVAQGGNQPDLKSIRCFLTARGQGVNYARGVWHHPLIALGDQSDFLVIDRDGKRSEPNCEEFSLIDAQISVPCLQTFKT